MLRDVFKRLRKLRPRHRDTGTRPWPDGPDPLVLDHSPGQANPILTLLDGWRLPRIEARSRVIERLGISPDAFYRGEIILLPEAVTLPGQISPWSASAFEGIPPQFPISRFSTLIWFEHDAHGNLSRTAEHISEHLGSAQIGQRWNTLVAAWRSGLAEIDLMSFPPEWQSGSLQNDAHDREPRLRTACRVNVATGFALLPGENEREWIESFRPIKFNGSVGAERQARVGTMAAFETELEYVRNASCLHAGVQSGIGLAGGDEALIVISGQLYVLPRTKLLRREVIRLTPAKGGGGSTLQAHCQTEAPGVASRSVFIANSPDPDGLNDLACELGQRLGCQVRLEPYQPDA